MLPLVESIDRGALIDVEDVDAEEHLAVGLVPEEAHVKHVKHPHRVAASRNTDQVEIVFPDLKVLSEARLELVHEDVQEADLADLVLLVREVRRVHLALETLQLRGQLCRGLYNHGCLSLFEAVAWLQLRTRERLLVP